jgi:hypothetical protein
MLKIGKINSKKIKAFLRRAPITLGEKAFLVFWSLLVLALLLGGIVFYGFYRAANQELEKTAQSSQLDFKESTYQKVLQTWDEREKNLRQTELKRYPDLFNL